MRARCLGIAVVLSTLGALSFAGPAAAASGVSGHVVDTAGNPVEGVEVCAERPLVLGTPHACVWTDASGGYSIPSAVAGELIHFSSPRRSTPAYAPQWWPGVPFSDEAQPVAEADVGRVDATMGPGGTVSGRLVSRATSLPIEGVRVCAFLVTFRELESTPCADSDAEGRFVLTGLSDAEYRIELWTERDINFVAMPLGPVAVHVGGTTRLEASLAPGVEVTGTVTDAATGAPAEALLAPNSMPRICAVEPVTEDPIKCTTFESDVRYKLPGIPPGRTFGVSFAVDVVEEGLDLGNDGFVRRYWDEAPNWSEATFITGSGGSVFDGVDAALTHGEEVFPHCELKDSCAAPSPAPAPPPQAPPPSEPIAGGSTPSPAGIPAPAPAHLPPVHCRAGFRRLVEAPKAKCVKVYEAHKRKHLPPTHPRRHRSAHR